MLGKSRSVLIGIVLVAVAVNVVQFRAIDSSVNSGYAALQRLSSVDFMESTTENLVIEKTYGMYLDLARVAPGAHILVPVEGNYARPAVRDHLLSLGEAESVTAADYDDAGGAAVSPEDLNSMPEYDVVATGTERVDGETNTIWQIVMGACSTNEASGASPELALMQIRDDHSTFALLIETCLLPDGTIRDA